MKKIICPVDYSDASLNAIQYAAQLTAHFGAQLTLIQIIQAHTLQDVASVSSGFPSTRKKREMAAEKQLGLHSKMVEEEFGIECRAHIVSDNADMEFALQEEIEENDYDLIVMGTDGADNLGQYYFGTHTYKMLRRVSCPLLIIPEGCDFKEWKRVVYAMNYEREDLDVMRKIMDFTHGFDPKITVLHISEKDTAFSEDLFNVFKDIMEDELESYSRVDFRRLTDEDPAIAIDFQMGRHDADLLVLLTRNYNFIEKIFRNSVSRKLSFIASYPVLIYHK